MMSDTVSYHEPREIPASVVAAVRAVRAVGWTDMFDRETVMVLAAALGFDGEANWLVDHRYLYFEALERTGLLPPGGARSTPVQAA